MDGGLKRTGANTTSNQQQLRHASKVSVQQHQFCSHPVAGHTVWVVCSHPSMAHTTLQGEANMQQLTVPRISTPQALGNSAHFPSSLSVLRQEHIPETHAWVC